MPKPNPTVKVEIPLISDGRAAFAAMAAALIKERHRLEEKIRVRIGQKITFSLVELNAIHAIYEWEVATEKE
jgi:hypothetical protein